MEAYEIAVWVLIALPVLMGALALLFKKKTPLLAIVAVNSIIVILLSIYLILALQANNIGQGQYLKIGAEGVIAGGLTVHQLIMYLDWALLFIFIVLGIYIRSWVVLPLALVQLVAIVWFEQNNGAAVEANAFALDYLSLVFVLICSIVGSLIALYGVQYMSEGEHNQGRFFFFILAFLGVMNGAVLSDNMIFLYFFWEATTLCCYFLIAHEGDKVSLANAKWAAEVTVAGGAALLLGILMFANVFGNNEESLSIMSLVERTDLPVASVFVAMPIFFVSLSGFTKSAQVPFQSWLLGAMVAPTPVSALLHSSTMVKLGVYVIIRMSPVIVQFDWLMLVIAFVGAYSFVSTALLAIQERSMKRLLAFSTVGNLGLIIMLAAIGTREAVAAAIVLTIFHAVSKALLFLSAGTVQKIFERKDIEGSEGLFRRAPALFGAFMVGIFTMFLTPFGVFIAKYAALTEAIINPVLIMMLVVGSIACEVFYVRWLGRTMAVTGEPVKKEVPSLYTGPMWTLGIGAVVLAAMLPLYYSGLLDHIVGFNHLDVTFPYISLDYTGFIPSAMIFIGLLFILYYAMRDDGGKKVEPYTGGMYDYKVELSCPYFEQYTKATKNMLYAEILGVVVLIVAFIGALVAGGVF